jgi:hypothetical protein
MGINCICFVLSIGILRSDFRRDQVAGVGVRPSIRPVLFRCPTNTNDWPHHSVQCLYDSNFWTPKRLRAIVAPKLHRSLYQFYCTCNTFIALQLAWCGRFYFGIVPIIGTTKAVCVEDIRRAHRILPTHRHTTRKCRIVARCEHTEGLTMDRLARLD